MSRHGRRPHVLYVAWGYPPMAGGGTYRTLATANMLVEVGFDVTVLTAERSAFIGFTGVDDDLVARIDPSIEVRRIPFQRPETIYDVREWPRERVERPKEWLAEYEEWAWNEFPEAVFGSWHRPMLEETERIHAARPVDLVIGSANPHVVLAAGDHLHRKYGIPHVIDHRDAWRLSCYLGVEVHTEEPRVAKLETQFMESAHRVWFVNQPILDWHQALYPSVAERMRVVENGYDPEFAPAPKLTPPEPDAPVQCTYIGSVGPRVPVEEFTVGWVEARAEHPELRNARADIFGPMVDVPGRDSLVAAAAEHALHHRGPVAKTDVGAVYGAADVLLLILGAGRYVTSGKLYEYVASGLPIVSVHEQGNGASDILRDYPLWFPVEDLTSASIGAALAAGVRAAREATPESRAAAAEFGARYERSLQLRPAVEELFASVAGEEWA